MNKLSILENSKLVKGFVDFVLQRADGTIRVEKDNMITKATKHLALTSLFQDIVSMNSVMYGKYVKQGVGIVDNIYSNEQTKSFKTNMSAANVVLSLTPDQLAKINANTNFIDIYSEDFSNADKVLGYAVDNENPVADNKEGSLYYQANDYVADTDVVAKTFKYPDGVATGTINAVAMMPYAAIKSPRGINGGEQYAPGFTMSKLLDKVDPKYANFVSFSKNICPPGITGLTSNSEIIINYSQDGKSCHKIDLNTMQITDIDEITYPMTVTNVLDYIIIGSYLYYIVTASNSLRIYVYNMDSKSAVANFSLPSNSGYSIARFLYLNNVLYVTKMKNGSSYDNKCLYKLTKGSNDYFSAQEESAADYSGLFTIPSGLLAENVMFKNYGDKYIMFIGRSDVSENANRNYCTGYIFSDISNIRGSIEGCIPSIYKNDLIINNGTVAGILSIGKNTGSGPSTEGHYQSVTRINDTEIDLMSQGAFWTKAENWCNVFSIAVLTDPITKGASDVFYPTYGYRVL